jgi:adenylate cyclase
MRHREIERKFLTDDSYVLPVDGSMRIRQGYLVTTEAGEEVRVRCTDGRTWSLTYKRGVGKVRREHEIELTVEQFEVLWPVTEGHRLEKLRYVVDIGVPAYVDVHLGGLEGLRTVEVEFDSVAEHDVFEPPDWFGREISDDRAYKARVLVVDGLPQSS